VVLPNQDPDQADHLVDTAGPAEALRLLRQPGQSGENPFPGGCFERMAVLARTRLLSPAAT
jgi:hypothetical protein